MVISGGLKHRRYARLTLTLLCVVQLTCMYNYVQSDTVTVYTDYPAEMLLYYRCVHTKLNHFKLLHM